MERICNFYDYIIDRAAYTRWLNSESDSDNDYRYLLKMMRIAIASELTDKQKKYITAYFVDQMTMPEIAIHYGVNKSTVSRSIKAAKIRLERVIKYSSPALLRTALERN